MDRRRKKKRKYKVAVCVLTLGVICSVGVNLGLGFGLTKVSLEKSELRHQILELENQITNYRVSQTNQGIVIQQLEQENSEYQRLNENLENSLMSLVNQIAEAQQYDQYCIDILARTIHSEACDQCLEGKYAVGSVIRNRMDSNSYPDTYEEVIFQKSQFSGTQTSNFSDVIDDECVEVAQSIYYRTDTYDFPETVYHFKSLTCNADWGLKEYRTIEDHIFYWE